MNRDLFGFTVKNNLFIFLLIILLQVFEAKAAFAGKITILEEKYASDVAFFDEEGKKVYLDQFEDKTILLVFWATWCAPCLGEMPDLDLLQKDFRKLPFQVLAISEDFGGLPTIKEYYRQQEIRHLKVYHDYGNALFKDFAVAGLPTAFIINPDGKVVVSFKGAVNWHEDEVRRLILSYIPGNPPEPKNSYKQESLNQRVKPLKPLAPLEEEEKTIEKEQNLKEVIEQDKKEVKKDEQGE